MFSSFFIFNLSKPTSLYFMKMWLQPVWFSFPFFYSSLGYSNIDLKSKITADIGNCKKLISSTGGDIWVCLFSLASIIFPVFLSLLLPFVDFVFSRWSDTWYWIYFFFFFWICALQPTECFLSQPEEKQESAVKPKKRKKVWMSWGVGGGIKFITGTTLWCEAA